MYHPFQQFLRLSSKQRWLVLQATVILPVTYAGLELFGFQNLLTLMQRFTPGPGRVRSPEELQADSTLFTAVVRRFPLPMRCLGRSVALCWLLRLRRVNATVHIGVRKNQHDLDAHAWVQCGDFVINEAEDVAQRYARIVPNYPRVERRLF
ncbi:MAG TPA: lasso peptide biosynthesis B2 protein [Candidatus Sulfotelmatobacter sp.]|nr:lasso peptide biosynthesis B2 protein [Candidatus Sulfotelmatobacter sp.]